MDEDAFSIGRTLTGVLLEGARAGEAPRGDCPPLPPGGPFFMQRFDGGPPPPGHDRVFFAMMPLNEFDLDKDGRISRAEIDRALKARFEAADANDDGALDPAEFEKAMPRPPEGMPPAPGPMTGHPPGPGREWACKGGRPDPGQMFKHLDWNLDGELSFEEFATPVRQMALRLDRNGDGVIDAEELRAPPGFGPPGFAAPPGPPPHEW